MYCGDRFCSICSLPRLARVRSRLQYLIRQVKDTKELRTRFLTLTIRNQSDLPGMIRKLLKYFKLYRSTKLWKSSVHGGAFVIEVTGKEGDWHAHLHVVLQSTWLAYKEHQPAWNRISNALGWYCKIIPPERAVGYLTKYLSKTSVASEEMALVGRTLANYRLFQTFGNWYGRMVGYQKPARICSRCGGENYFPTDIWLSSEISWERWQASIHAAEDLEKTTEKGYPELDTPFLPLPFASML